MRAFFLVLLAAVGCNQRPLPSQDPTPPSTPPSAPPSAPSAGAQRRAPEAPEEPRQLLAPLALDSRQPARRTLFSWTTKEQAEELAKTRKLLVKNASDARAPSPFEESLKRRGSPVGSRLSTLLTRPPLDRRRYAFPSPVGWALGVEGKPYGSALLRITLRPDAILLILDGAPDPELAPFRAVNAEGARVAAAEIERQPRRVAAVFHESTDPRGVSFREYVVVNEGMVESWALGTEDIEAELTRDRQTLERLLAVTPDDTAPDPSMPRAAWHGLAEQRPEAPWGAVLGVGSAPYVWSKKNVSRVVEQLKGAEKLAPVQHSPEPAGPLKMPAATPAAPPRRVWVT